MKTQQDDTRAASLRKGKILRRKILSGVIAIIAISVIVFVFMSRSGKSDELDNMVTAQAERTSITQKISATGTVNAQTGAQINIGSQVTGRIKRLFADVGSHVSANQVIAELDLPDVNAQLGEQIANLDASQMKLMEQQSGVGLQKTTTSGTITKTRADLASAKIAYNQAVKNANLEVSTAQAAVKQAHASARNAATALKRNQQLLAKGYIAQQDVDNSQTQYDVAAAQLESSQQNLNLTKIKTQDDIEVAKNSMKSAQSSLNMAFAGTAQDSIKLQSVAEARAAVKQASAQVAYSRAQFNKTVIRTPISGTVITLAAQQGETVAAGLSAPTLITVVDLNRLQVDAYVDETDIGRVHLGQSVLVTVDAYPDRQFKGKVVKIASGSTVQQNVVTYDTTIALESPGGLLKPGMTATVDILAGVRENVIAVPIEAVKSIKNGQVVYVLEGKKIVPRQVTTGISDDAMTEILSGIKEGERIILAGYQSKQPARSSSPFGQARGGH